MHILLPSPYKMQRAPRLAIVGYREFTDFKRFSESVDAWILEYEDPDVIISGGCRGTDTLAETYAKLRGIGMIVRKPKDPSKKQDYIVRNYQIADECTHMIAFLSPKSRGTVHTIEFAKKQGKPVTIVNV